jgi:hypothetical protein
MNNPHRARPDETNSSGVVAHELSQEISQLLLGLERQKEELGPIAEELLELLHRLGVSESPPDGTDFNPSNG